MPEPAEGTRGAFERAGKYEAFAGPATVRQRREKRSEGNRVVAGPGAPKRPGFAARFFGGGGYLGGLRGAPPPVRRHREWSDGLHRRREPGLGAHFDRGLRELSRACVIAHAERPERDARERGRPL